MSLQRVIRSASSLVPGIEFSRSRIEWRYFRLDQIQDGGRPSSWKFSNGHISATGHAIYFAFGSVVGFRVGGSNVSTSGWSKSKIAVVSRLV